MDFLSDNGIMKSVNIIFIQPDIFRNQEDLPGPSKLISRANSKHIFGSKAGVCKAWQIVIPQQFVLS
ncbi:MAG: hypothetical protein HFG08_11590 [Oscillibacter sp.]|nr:hypothetical protein [Oscillibacter sp.]